MRRVDGEATCMAVYETAERRHVVEVLRTRAHLLVGEDRALVEMYLEHGGSFRQIGRLMGLTAGTVGRRTRRIIRRLADDTYELCLANREDFNGRELAVIKDRFVRGLAERRISRSRGITLYRARSILQKARTYVASMKGGNA